MGKRERMRGTDSVVFGRCTHVREEGRCALCEVTIFSREGGARRGVFFRPLPARGTGRRAAAAQCVRVTRASVVFRFFPSLLHRLDVSGWTRAGCG